MKLSQNFKLNEFLHQGIECIPTEVMDNLDELADSLQVLRNEINAPININSGYRTHDHNKKVGGSPTSQHLLGKAADMWVSGWEPERLHGVIERLIRIGKMKQGGLGLYDTFVHYDIRGYRARWDFRTKG